MKITSLTVNNLVAPFGVVNPSFSWKMESSRNGASQTAYRLRVCVGHGSEISQVWDSGEIPSSISCGIPYSGPALESARNYRWTVSVKDETGSWTDSESTPFSSAIDSSFWAKSKWIAVAKTPNADRDTSIFIKSIANDAPVAEAWWFVAGMGVFEAYVGGEPISHMLDDGSTVRDALKPGFTHIEKRRSYFSYDITHLVKKDAGDTNVFSALCTGGWWRDQITGHRGDSTAFRCVIVLRYANGTTSILGSDESWMAAYAGPLPRADIFYGEDFDFRNLAKWRHWATTGDLGVNPDQADPIWLPARTDISFSGELVPLKGSPIRHRDDLAIAPASIRVWSGIEGADDSHYGHVRVVREYANNDELAVNPGENLQIDFGQNCAGVPEFVLTGTPNTRVTVRFAEMLCDGNGAYDRFNDGPEGELYKMNYRDARAEIHLFLADGEVVYRPRFTFFGYRYISVSTERGAIKIKRVRSIPVTSLTPEMESGNIETAVPILNRLIANGIWGQRSNYLSIPTDCPQRNERLGWTADTQVFTATACYNANVAGFLTKWMDDMRDSQDPDGSFPGVAPLAQYGGLMHQLGWADAGIIVPWTVWRILGNTDIVNENWDAMVRYMNLLEDMKYTSATSRSHQWADWLSCEKLESCGGGAYEKAPDGTHRPKADALVYWQYLGCCYWLWDSQMMAEMADNTGRAAEASAFRAMAGRARDFIRSKFIDPDDGLLIPLFRDMQTPALFALKLDLLNDAAATTTRDALLENMREHGNCLQTGFLGTSILMDTLSKIGALDTAYTLLLQRRYPSWLYPIDQGATTFWERWNSYTKETGFGNAGMNSFNHYAYGAVISWLYSAMGGIQPDSKVPGFKHFILKPQPDPRVPSVKVAFDSPYGKIESDWHYDESGSWHWTYTIPANTSATVILPDGSSFEQTSGTYSA